MANPLSDRPGLRRAIGTVGTMGTGHQWHGMSRSMSEGGCEPTKMGQ